MGSAVMPVPLQDLDLVAVRVLDEEETRQQLAVALEFLHLGWLMAQLDDAFALGGRVGYDNRNVPVARAVRVGLLPALVQGQLDLEVVLGVAQVRKGEVREIEPVRLLHAQDFAIKAQRPIEVEDADHRMNHFGHGALALSGTAGIMRQAGSLRCARRRQLGCLPRGARRYRVRWAPADRTRAACRLTAEAALRQRE